MSLTSLLAARYKEDRPGVSEKSPLDPSWPSRRECGDARHHPEFWLHPAFGLLLIINGQPVLRLGGDLDFELLDHTASSARRTATGAVALFARWLLHVQEFQGDRIEEPGESRAVAR